MQDARSSKGFAGSIKRTALLPIRYGLGPAKIERRLRLMGSLLQRQEVTPTVPTTAVILERHPEICRALTGFDVAVHGYRHVAYAQLSPEEQMSDLQRATDVFESLGLPIRGFRTPYLRPHPETCSILSQRGFLFDSSATQFALPADHPAASAARSLAVMRYGTESVGDATQALGGGLTELPVSLPDDEILTDGLSITQASTLSRIFEAMLDYVRTSGRLLALQVHPERFQLFWPAIQVLLRHSTDDSAWTAPLSEIAGWVQKRGVSDSWPNGSPYAVSVTGDLDALTLGDFACRVLGS